METPQARITTTPADLLRTMIPAVVPPRPPYWGDASTTSASALAPQGGQAGAREGLTLWCSQTSDSGGD